MRISPLMKAVALVSKILFISAKICFSQLSNTLDRVEDYNYSKYVSNIAYKLPYRGNNYKFYGTFSYHIYGKAFASCKIHNTIIEAFQQCAYANSSAKYKILRSSGKRKGKIVPLDVKKNGNYAVFMTPLLKKDKTLNFYYRTGLFRKFIKYNKSGISQSNENITLDFENTALLILELDKAANIYGMKIKKVMFNRFFSDDLYSTKFGAELKKREIYFPKYLSQKVNRKYDDLFYVEFEPK